MLMTPYYYFFSVLGEATTPEQGARVAAVIAAVVCSYTAQQRLEL